MYLSLACGKPLSRDTWMRAGFQHGERGDDERRAMVEKHRDRLLQGVRPIQDCMRDPVCGSIKLVYK